MRRAVVIVNPVARGGRSRVREASAAFASIGVEVALHQTTGPGHATELALGLATELESSGESLYVLGGDGTVMEAVGALVGRSVPVGILPGGTGNQLARVLGIPLNVRRAVHALARPRVERFDLGRLAEGRHFAITAGMGLDAAMIARTSTAAKRRFGVAAYLVSAARATLRPPRFDVRIVADGRTIEREASVAMIANVGAVMNGRFALGPGVRHDDEWLNLALLAPRGVADGLVMATRLARSDFRPHAGMLFLRAREIRIECDVDVLVQADGELLGGRSLDARVVPAAVRFLAPAV